MAKLGNIFYIYFVYTSLIRSWIANGLLGHGSDYPRSDSQVYIVDLTKGMSYPPLLPLYLKTVFYLAV